MLTSMQTESGPSVRNPVMSYFRWLVAVYRKVLTVTTSTTVASVVFSIAAKIFLLLSVLLPLKAIMVVGLNSVPTVFSDTFPRLTVAELAVALIMVTILSYIFGIYSQLVVENNIGRAAMLFTKKYRKVSAGGNIVDITEGLLRLVIGSLSGLIFFLALAAILSVFSPGLVATLFILLVSPIFLLTLLANLDSQQVNTWLWVNRTKIQQRMFFVIFMAILVFVVYGSLTRTDAQDGFVLLISFVLGRRALIAFNDTVSTGIKMHIRREEMLNYLFFITQAEFLSPQDQVIKVLLSTENFNQARQLLLGEEGISAQEVKSISWRDLGVPGTYCFHLTTYSAREAVQRDFLLKIFDKKTGAGGTHEKLILSNDACGPKFCAGLRRTLRREGFTYLLLNNVGREDSSNHQYRHKLKSALVKMWSISGAVDLIDAYSRSHSPSLDGLRASSLEGLKLLVENNERGVELRKFLDSFEEILAHVSCVPTGLHNPDLNSRTIGCDTSGSPIILHWARWSVQHLGAVLWKFPFLKNEDLTEILCEISEQRGDIGHLNCYDLRLVGQVYQLNSLVRKRHLSRALRCAGMVAATYQRVLSSRCDTASLSKL